MIRRYGNPPMRRDYTFRPGIYAILPRSGRVLVTHQSGPVPEFQLPGGGIDAGEQPRIALAREVLEETGWTIARPKRLCAYRRFTFMPEYGIWAEKLCQIYIAHPVRQIAEPSEPGHLAIWLNADDAVERLASHGDRSTLKALLY